ncbi:hypothetical protein Tco_0837635 [Tanacetum coccineum]
MIGLHEYAIRKKIIESKTTEPKDDTSESKTSETVGKTYKVKISKPKINRDKVIIEDWNSDDEDDVSEVNTGEPVWDNAKRVNHQKFSNKLKYPQTRRNFVPKGVLTKTGLINPVRPNGRRAVHTVSTAKALWVKNMTTARTRAVVNTGKGKMDNTFKIVRWVSESLRNYHVSCVKESGSFMLKKFEYADPKGISNYLSDDAVYNGGFVALGSDQEGKPPSISFLSVWVPLTILNTLDPLDKFDGKSDEGYLLGYSTSSKAFRVYNKRTKRVEENMHIDFLEDQPNVAGSGPDWMFNQKMIRNLLRIHNASTSPAIGPRI